MKQGLEDLAVPVSLGELLDKITILRIKNSRIKRPEALNNIKTELHTLSKVFNKYKMLANDGSLLLLIENLQTINSKLWDVEDSLRVQETKNLFDNHFINLARSVYKLNDKRASIKRQINEIYGSCLIEEKSYGEQS